MATKNDAMRDDGFSGLSIWRFQKISARAEIGAMGRQGQKVHQAKPTALSSRSAGLWVIAAGRMQRTQN
jgi:hypothetical protein